jgi:hypothetical protein
MPDKNEHRREDALFSDNAFVGGKSGLNSA